MNQIMILKRQLEHITYEKKTKILYTKILALREKVYTSININIYYCKINQKRIRIYFQKC